MCLPPAASRMRDFYCCPAKREPTALATNTIWLADFLCATWNIQAATFCLQIRSQISTLIREKRAQPSGRPAFLGNSCHTFVFRTRVGASYDCPICAFCLKHPSFMASTGGEIFCEI